MKKISKTLTAIAAISLSFALLGPTAEANVAGGGKTCPQTQYVLLHSSTPNPTKHTHTHHPTSGQPRSFTSPTQTTGFNSTPGWYKSKWTITTGSVDPISFYGRCVTA